MITHTAKKSLKSSSIPRNFPQRGRERGHDTGHIRRFIRWSPIKFLWPILTRRGRGGAHTEIIDLIQSKKELL